VGLCCLLLTALALNAQRSGWPDLGLVAKPARVVVLASCFLLGIALPVAVMFARDSVRRTRLATLDELGTFATGDRNRAATLPSLELILFKYSNERAHDGDNWIYYVFPGIIFAAVCCLGFLNIMFLAADDQYWQDQNFLLSGFLDVAGPRPDATRRDATRRPAARRAPAPASTSWSSASARPGRRSPSASRAPTSGPSST
jgi:hypothetical protein